MQPLTHNRIGKRLILWIIGFSSLVTLIITAVQLVLEYNHLHDHAERGLDDVVIYVPSITNDLWTLNEEQIKLALDGLVQLTQIQYASVTTDTMDRQWSAGEEGLSNMLIRRYPLLYQAFNGEVEIGTLEVAADLNDIYREVGVQAVGILFGNAIKTFLVAIFMLFLIQKLVTSKVQRLATMASDLPGAVGDDNQANNALIPSVLDEVDQVGWILEKTQEQLKSSVSRLKEAHAELKHRDQQQQVYLETLALMDETVIEMDINGIIVSSSPGLHQMIDTDVMDTPLVNFVHADDVPRLADVFAKFKVAQKEPSQIQIRLKEDSGAERWIEIRLLPNYDPDNGALTSVRGVLRDVTVSRSQELQMAHMALHDTLTNLPNRSLLDDRISLALRQAKRKGLQAALLFIDIDHFKKINDNLGHKTGDKLLLELSRRLGSQIRSGDTLSRWGGDEFVILLPELASTEQAKEVAHKIQASMREPVIIGEDEFIISLSIGGTLFPTDAENPEGLLVCADRAMFFSKNQGRNQVCFFEDIAETDHHDHDFYLHNKLPEAIQSNQIEAWFQPIVNAQTGQCVILEALARWHDAERGWINPSAFISIAENSGLIGELGHKIWLQSLTALQELKNDGHDIRVAVNISMRQLFSSELKLQMLQELRERQLNPADIILEVTESVALLDVANANAHLNDLKDAGFLLAIDDFGTGYSALSQLHDMPVDELKIDISFVRRIDDPSGRKMIETIVQLAKSLNLSSTAEGVEDEATAAALTDMGVTNLQGYYFSKPAPPSEIKTWLLRSQQNSSA